MVSNIELQISWSDCHYTNLRPTPIDGDVNLLKHDEFWDPHAIAGLLKQFLRDLPTSILTRELQQRFLSVVGTFALH